jgi:demethylmenaquinone methyltransferase/2-methoxy-6-polyprenyl-1,4-benzoquinol methylase
MKNTARGIFNGLSGSYDSVLRYATLLQDDRWKQWLVSRSLAAAGQMVLDVGCGTAVLERWLRAKRCNIVGIDLTEKMLRVAQRKDPALAGTLLVGDAESLPFHDGQFDYVFSCYVAKYARLEEFASEIHRVLKPGGKIMLYDFCRPRGLFGIAYSFYLEFLRIVAKVPTKAGVGILFTFEKLPQILFKSTWDDEMETVLRRHQFESISWKRLTHGVVTAFWAFKGDVRPSP